MPRFEGRDGHRAVVGSRGISGIRHFVDRSARSSDVIEVKDARR